MIYMQEIILRKSKNKSNKYDATVDGKTVSFGASGYSDFTIHKDEERKKNYDARHKPSENWNDLTTAGAWSKWILWNKPTLRESVRDMEKRFGVKIKYQN